ncbi:MAG: hypothetical protein J6B06_01070 [Lachnospiraceae bacterium]|nr:hypothetical protein [Lachnospiraceae bacterium]
MLFSLTGIIGACVGVYLLRKKMRWKRCPPIGASSSDAIMYLKPGKNQVKEKEMLWRNKLLTGIYVLLAGSVVTFACQVYSMMGEGEVTVSQIERPEPGEGDTRISLSAWLDTEEIPLIVEVGERIPKEDEANQAIEQSYRLLKERITGENPSLDEVSRNLNLPSYLEETGCSIYWYIDNTERIDRNGAVNTEDILDKEQVSLTAEISLGAYKKEFLFSVMVVPGEMNEQERLAYDIRQAVKRAEKESGEESGFMLPQTVGEKKIVYREPSANQEWIVWMLVILLAVCSTFLPEQKLLEEKKKKEKELMLAYPEIVSKLCLLIGSGLTVRRAWQRIVQDYKDRKVKNYAYEEMLFSYYELERGLPEGGVYAAFGRRCRQHGYRKLGSLLEQNLKKGTAGLLELLQEETWQAFEDRRAFAVKLAQEAGTRMLLPMILLLMVVLIICIAPAVMSF